MRDCYADYKYENFRTNLRSLRLSVKNGLSRAEADEEAYLHDKALYGKTADGAWHRSVAYTLLKDDIKTGKIVGRKPKEVYESRNEYKTFPLKKFRNQIYHEHERIEKINLIKNGMHPRFNRLKKHDPHKYKVESSEIFPNKS